MIDLGKNDKRVTQVIQTLTEAYAMNQLVFAELMFGIDPTNPKHAAEEQWYRQLKTGAQYFVLTDEAITRAHDLYWKLIQKGQRIGEVDALIAAIYLTNGVTTILTKNKKHFDRVPGLKVLSY